MKVSILNAQRTLFEGVVSMVSLPGSDGELSLMDDHEPIFAALKKGPIRMEPIARRVTLRPGTSQGPGGTGRIKSIFINQGMARMEGNELVVLVE